MTEPQPLPPPNWSTCQIEDDCIGVQLDADDRGCVHHTTDEQVRARWWAHVRDGGPLDARGLAFTGDQLPELLDAAPRDEQDRPHFAAANFERATFEGVAAFERATFEGHAVFSGATFARDAVFERATFARYAVFARAMFAGDAVFSEATFARDAVFERATFAGDAWFEQSTFAGGAWFERATFAGDTWFSETTFAGDAWFSGATFAGHAWFERARFEGVASLGPMLVVNRLGLGNATFASRLDLQVATPRLDCTRSRIVGGGHLRVAVASVNLTDAEIPEPCILEDGADRLRHQDELWNRIDSAKRREALREVLSLTVELVSLRRATVTGLTLGAIDLRHCRFHGAHDLQRLRIPHTAQLHQAPAPARRQVLAEEAIWRRAQGAKRWQQLQVAEIPDPTPAKAGGLEPIDVAELYRQLRRGRETRGDQPGAADFYYGEMEMRRKSPSASWAERRILDAYWLLSGYALRASRALGALVALIALGSVALWSFGYQESSAQQAAPASDGGAVQAEAAGWWDVVLTSAESVILREPENAGALTTLGRVTSLVLRTVGPVLLVLAVLSLRGRVKR